MYNMCSKCRSTGGRKYLCDKCVDEKFKEQEELLSKATASLKLANDQVTDECVKNEELQAKVEKEWKRWRRVQDNVEEKLKKTIQDLRDDKVTLEADCALSGVAYLELQKDSKELIEFLAEEIRNFEYQEFSVEQTVEDVIRKAKATMKRVKEEKQS